jgi:hypothetical protein
MGYAAMDESEYSKADFPPYLHFSLMRCNEVAFRDGATHLEERKLNPKLMIS